MPSEAERSELIDHAVERFGFLARRGGVASIDDGPEFTVITHTLPDVVVEYEFDWREMLSTLSVRDVRVTEPPEDGRLVVGGRHVRHGLAVALHLAGIPAPEFHRDAREVEGHWGPARVKTITNVTATALEAHIDPLLERMDRVFPLEAA